MAKNVIEVGTVQYGQNRDFIVHFNANVPLEAKITYYTSKE